MNDVPLIPRSILFGNPERISPHISPDGKHIAYIAPDAQNILQVWVGGARGEAARQVTADKKRGIRSFTWCYMGASLIYSQDIGGDENFHLYRVDLNTNEVKDITPFENVQARLVGLEARIPQEALVAMNANDARRHDVYRINLQSGVATLDTENPGTVVGWCADAQLRVRAALSASEDGGYDLLLRDALEPWRVARHWAPGDQGSPVEFSLDGKTLYLLANHDAEAQRLITLELASGKESVIAEDAQFDLSGVLFHPVTRLLQAVSFYREKLYWQAIDPSLERDFTALKEVRPGQFNIDSRDEIDERWVVSYVTDDGPVFYYLYTRSDQKVHLLFSHQPKLENLPLVAHQPVVITARDGLRLHGYLAKPRFGTVPFPTILYVHGGPWARDTWGYNRTVQWLANRGYAVLQINFRGSTGYGKAFLNAGDRQWAAAMHDDLIDSVNWLIKEKIADPKRVGIMGGSYGGYATLVGLTFTPEVFAAGVDIVGPSHIRTLLQTIPPYWSSMKVMFTKRVGDEKDIEFLEARSPLNFVDRIQSPLLIGQGANDPRVKLSESEQIVAAMRKAGKPVEYIVYSDEGHGFARPDNNMHFFAHTEAFLARYLGGRCEPEGELKNHSAVVQSYS